jgi:Transposase DDE domain/Domain of unknown function (DUF4372)
MSKSTFFTGQPIFAQILSFFQRSAIDRIAKQYEADRYCKTFTTFSHLVTMLYGVLNKCQSIREVTSGLLAWETRLAHLGIESAPKRSTLSDANSRRSEEVFAKIYEHLYQDYRRLLPDSRSARGKMKDLQLFIVDSTTVSLFSDILKNAGRTPVSGKKKGGLKVHTMIQSDEDVPCLVRMSAASAHDSPFLAQIRLAEGSIITFDKGYNDYTQYNRFTKEKVSWITRIRNSAVYELRQDLSVSQEQSKDGVCKDRLITLGHRTSDKMVQARVIDFTDPESKKQFRFLTNDELLPSSTVAALYKRRWQIETVFKRFKQNYPLKYFLGDSQNAIKIQVWCSMIADLLIKIIKSHAGGKWSFSNLTSFVRIHLMTYIDIYDFLKNPEKALRAKQVKPPAPPSLFST